MVPMRRPARARLASLMVTGELLTEAVSLLWGPLLAFVSLDQFAL